MVKTIDDDTLDRAVTALWNDHTYELGKTKLRMRKEYQLTPQDSPQDECISVSMDTNTPEDYRATLAKEFEGYKVFYDYGKKPVPQNK